MNEPNEPVAPVKDEEASQPVASQWRPTLSGIVRALVKDDYASVAGIPGVDALAHATIEQIRAYLLDYGATLVELPDATWETSCAQWMGGRWDVLVDLWTAE